MIHQLDKINLILSSDPLPFMEGQRSEIDRYWDSVMFGNNRLWNGDFYMFSEARIENREIIARGHKTDFATFLYWRDHGFDAAITHISGSTFPHFADGSLLTIKMADHTANAGRVYFPAGSFDADDICDGSFDVTSNVRRELKEEIGLDVQASWYSGPFLAAESTSAFVICRAMRLPIGFEQIEQDWKIHRANGGDDEIECLVPICHPSDIPLEMPSYAAALCHYHFESME